MENTITPGMEIAWLNAGIWILRASGKFLQMKASPVLEGEIQRTP
jgi:hypothetical protein